MCVCVRACMSLCVVNRWVGQNSFHPPGDEGSEFYTHTHTNNKVLITMAGRKTVVKVGRLAARPEGPFSQFSFQNKLLNGLWFVIFTTPSWLFIFLPCIHAYRRCTHCDSINSGIISARYGARSVSRPFIASFSAAKLPSIKVARDF